MSGGNSGTPALRAQIGANREPAAGRDPSIRSALRFPTTMAALDPFAATSPVSVRLEPSRDVSAAVLRWSGGAGRDRV